MNPDTQTVYMLHPARGTKDPMESFVDCAADIRDLVIQNYWGTLVDVPVGLLEVTVDMTQMMASVRNTRYNVTTWYDILAFDKREV